jgi:hypothetical protein
MQFKDAFRTHFSTYSGKLFAPEFFDEHIVSDVEFSTGLKSLSVKVELGPLPE